MDGIERIVVFVIGIIVGIGIILFVITSTERTDEFMEAMDEYTDCVYDTYGISPIQYKNNFGKMPTC